MKAAFYCNLRMYAGGCRNQEKKPEFGLESHKWANIHHLDNLESPLTTHRPRPHRRPTKSRGSNGLPRRCGPRLGSHLRIAAIAPTGAQAPELAGVQVLQDAEGQFTRLYGQAAYLVRPDGYIGWRGGWGAGSMRV